MVDAAVLEEAYAARTYRANLVEEAFMEDYDREMIKVRTSAAPWGRSTGFPSLGTAILSSACRTAFPAL